MQKRFLLVILGFLLAMQTVLADILAPVSTMMIPLIPFIILIEGVVLWLLARFWLKIKMGFWRIALLVASANIVTSLIGTLTTPISYSMEYSMWLFFAFIGSIFVEWGVLVLMIKHLKLYKKVKIKNKHLLIISLIANIATYIPLIFFFGSA